MKIKVSSPIVETARVAQVRGIFDLEPEEKSQIEWEVNLPIKEKAWNIGLIVGPSGCGKTTIAKKLWGKITPSHSWNKKESVLDGFPEEMPVKEIVEIMSSVGFSSPPAWLRPYHVLSTGQKFRVTLARVIADVLFSSVRNSLHSSSDVDRIHENETTVPTIVFDEYTSVVDRTVAKIASAALAKTIRRKNLQFVAITCHEDVEEWLCPDWVYRPAEDFFRWSRARTRPGIELEIVRCKTPAWKLFAPHHYLSQSHNPGTTSFLASWEEKPVAFSSWIIHMGNGPKAKREHRTVTLPDYQGVGIGNALSDFCASLWKALGFKVFSVTTHPAMINSRVKSSNWKMHRNPSMCKAKHKATVKKFQHAITRLTAGFTYIGPGMQKQLAEAMLDE